MNVWLWFRPFFRVAVIAVYTVMLIWAVLTGGQVPGLWVGQ